MFCQKCGKEIADNAVFCKFCGEKVRREEVKQEKAEKRPIVVGLVIGVIIGLGLLIITAAVIIGRNRLNKNVKPTENQTLETVEIETESEEKNTEDISENVQASEEEPKTAEETLRENIEALNSDTYMEQSISIYAQNYNPSVRDASAIWDNTIFYVMEGYQNSNIYFDKNICTLEKKCLINADTGNRIEYEIYKNPDSGVANKIVSIEYLSDGLEVTEYYYTNEGKINFIFQYNSDNYISAYATPDKVGTRYLFHNDSLVTLRNITSEQTVNYIVGTNEAERMKNQFAQSTMRYYDSLSQDEKNYFDTSERDMINAAYNTYNVLADTPGIATLQGYVYDQDINGFGDVLVELYTADFGTLLYSTKTDANGLYCISVPNESYEYAIRLRKEGYTSCDIYAIAMNSDQIGVYQDSAYMMPDSNLSADVSIGLGDALNYAADGIGMRQLAYADVKVRAGINNKQGDVILQRQADDTGYVVLNLPLGVYTIEVSLSGYETMYYTIVSNQRMNDNYEFYATPVLNQGEYAIVLTWGYTPSDLDSHLFSTAPNQESNHIWYGHLTDMNGSDLDVDDTSSYGPETVTIRNFSPQNYYKYCVVDYTDCSRGDTNSTDMSYSNACVNVYSANGLIATYHVPLGKNGVIWEVFEIRNGYISPIQRYYNNVEDKTWWNNEK